ncbi:hypothetical protein GOBAR_DD11680 [Gossypium barbadense]|nr:hypothetical protein GOBAR_DD11680 [Gossypium barbadense]
MMLLSVTPLHLRKLNSFLRPKLQGLARNKGISFVPIDQSRPLSDQGPFDIVLHKMTGREWRQILEVGLGSRSYSFCFFLGMMEYRQTHPKVLVLDPPDAIQHLHNRQSMLQCVADMNLFESYVAKPFVNDGSEKSHELSLAYDQYSLQKLEPPLVLQEFVNHGGVLFKVFIVGEAIKVVRRFSLPDVTIRELSTNVGVYQFPRVSCAAACADDADLDPSVAELPPWPLLERLAKELQQRLTLSGSTEQGIISMSLTSTTFLASEFGFAIPIMIKGPSLLAGCGQRGFQTLEYP